MNHNLLSRIVSVAIALAVSCALAMGSDRVITSFESGEDLSGWSGGTVVTQHASAGARAYAVPAGGTAALVLQDDWSPFRHLKFDVVNPGAVVSMNVRVTDASGRDITSWEYSVYAGRTTQHVRIDGLRNDFTLGGGIDTSQVARLEIVFGQRSPGDTCQDGLYVDNVRLSTERTEPYADGPDVETSKPAGFVLPEFPGFEAGYHTWAIDPAAYQLLTLPGTGRDGTGRALEFKPLNVDHITIWDSPRTFAQAGTYVVTYWVKGPAGAVFRDGDHVTDLTPQWQQVQYELPMEAGGTHRFVLKAENLQRQSVWLDDFAVCLKGATGDLEPVSHATGKPTVVTWADGICYVNGKPTFMLGFMRADPERLAGTPFNFCFPGELTQPDMSYMDRCAELGLLTSVNLTATTRALAPNAAARFARKYKDHPALFSYYLCDEPNHGSPSAVSEPPVLARASDVIHAIDPNHPTETTIIPWNASAIYRFRDVVDISGGDEYVVKGTVDNADLWKVWRSNETFRRSALDGEPNIFIPLASNRGKITREESWAQAYMCIAAGAGGILWFEFDGAQPVWQDYLDLGKELRSIEEFLVGVELEKGLAFAGDNGQLRGIGRAAADRTALITVNLYPTEVKEAKITAPFLAHARQAEVLFEHRTVPVENGVIADSFAGLARHVYVVDGVPAGVAPRPVPKPGGPHVTDAGKAWRIDTAAPVGGRSEAEIARERFLRDEIAKAEAAARRGDKAEARRIYEGILERYPDAQDVRERVRSL
jgi:hypothetical protein